MIIYFQGASAYLSRFVHSFAIWKLSVANSYDAYLMTLEAALKVYNFKFFIYFILHTESYWYVLMNITFGSALYAQP
jgi:hypothetical protein